MNKGERACNRGGQQTQGKVALGTLCNVHMIRHSQKPGNRKKPGMRKCVFNIRG